MTIYLNSFLTSISKARTQCLYSQGMAGNSVEYTPSPGVNFFSIAHLLFISTCTEQKKQTNKQKNKQQQQQQKFSGLLH